jgi:hypothetical protein
VGIVRGAGLSGRLIAAIIACTVLAVTGAQSSGASSTADVSGTMRFYPPNSVAGFPDGTLRPGFVEFLSKDGTVTKVAVPKSGRFSADLATGDYIVRGHLAQSNLWCTVGGNRTIRVVQHRELQIKVGCDAL